IVRAGLSDPAKLLGAVRAADDISGRIDAINAALVDSCCRGDRKPHAFAVILYGPNSVARESHQLPPFIARNFFCAVASSKPSAINALILNRSCSVTAPSSDTLGRR